MAETDNFNVEQWKEQKNAEKTFAFDTIEKTALSLNNPANLVTYLDVQARFDKYSVGNALLVAAQKPDATKLADSKTWREKKVFIRKGEKGIILLQPGKEYTHADGTAGTSFDTKKMFDITQTTSLIKTEEQSGPDVKGLIKNLMKLSQVPILIDDSITGAEYSSDDECIRIRNGMDPENIFRCLSEEIVAGMTGNDRVQAYCVSYLLCVRNGISPSECRLEKPFEGMDSKQIKAVLNEVRNTASKLEYSLNPEINRDTRSRGEAR